MTNQPPRRVYFRTFGCQMNEYDTGKMRAQLVADGFVETTEPEEADVILLNTCSIREKAVDKMRSVLGDYRGMKRRGKRVTIGVAGCVAQQEGQRLLDQYKELDLVFGPDGIPAVRELVNKAIESRSQVLDTDFLDLDNYPFVADVDPSDHGVGAFVTIQKGCDNKCTFCIVPSTRGAEVSRPHQQILDEVRAFTDRGVQEITLIGQNVNSYGLKQPGEITFAELLFKVAEVPGVKRIRYTTSHPRDMGDDVIIAHRDIEALCPQLHLPVQSGSNKVLRRMKRYYTRERFLEIVGKLYDARPGFKLTTDVIVGFPGETDEDFRELCDFIEKQAFDHVGVFTYFQEEGTPAADLPNQVPEEVKVARQEELMALQARVSKDKLKGLVGSVVDVLVEGVSDESELLLRGRTARQAPDVDGQVYIVSPPDDAEVGQIRPLRVTRTGDYDLVGELIKR